MAALPICAEGLVIAIVIVADIVIAIVIVAVIGTDIGDGWLSGCAFCECGDGRPCCMSRAVSSVYP